MAKKYELYPDYDYSKGAPLMRVRALRDFGDVKKGDLGGVVSGEHNLPQSGDCWLSYWCKLLGQSTLSDDAQLKGRVTVVDNVSISDRVIVAGDSMVRGSAVLRGNVRVNGKVFIKDNVVLEHDVTVYGSPRIEGNSRLSGKVIVSDSARILGDSVLKDNVRVKHHACVKDSLLTNQVVVEGMSFIDKSTVLGKSVVGGRSEVVESLCTYSPLYLGLSRPVTIMDTHMQVEFYLHSIETWRDFSDAQVSRMAGKKFLRFWKESRDYILHSADFHTKKKGLVT